MKICLIVIFAALVVQSQAQHAEVKTLSKGDKKSVYISIEKDGKFETFTASCSARRLTELSDSLKVTLIGNLLEKINDTAYSLNPVEAISYRYNGRHNRLPKSKDYNLQVAALLLINYLAFSSDAVSYSPFPVLYDKKKRKEFSTSGRELAFVIKCYKQWFKKIESGGLRNYDLPLVSARYEWYGTLYTTSKLYESSPPWEKLYDCPTGNFD